MPQNASQNSTLSSEKQKNKEAASPMDINRVRRQANRVIPAVKRHKLRFEKDVAEDLIAQRRVLQTAVACCGAVSFCTLDSGVWQGVLLLSDNAA